MATLSAVDLGLAPNGAQFKIVMRPYGFGPSTVYGSGLVILVDSSKPVGKAPAKVASRFAKSNLLVVVDTTHGGTVTKGGTYTATITLRSDGTKLLPILSQAALAK